MHCVSLITRPARAAALVVTVGLVFGLQSALALGDPGVEPGYALIGALVAATMALGVFAPLHSRSGSIAAAIARTGLSLAVIPVAGAFVTGWSIWLPLLVAALCIAALGMALLVRARRHEGDLSSRLLALTLAGTLFGVLFAPVGGGLVAGLLWLAVAAALWSAYAAPSALRTSQPA